MDLNGNVESAFNPETGARESFVNGLSPEEAATQRVQQRLAPQTRAGAPTSKPTPTATTPQSNAEVALSRAPTVQSRLDAAHKGGAPGPTNLSEGKPDPAKGTDTLPAAVDLGRGAGVQGPGLPHDVAVLTNAARRNQPDLPLGTYGKVFQTDPTHTVNPGEVAFLNGKPVAPGNAVTFTGFGGRGAVVQQTPAPTARGASPAVSGGTPQPNLLLRPKDAAPGPVTTAAGIYDFSKIGDPATAGTNGPPAPNPPLAPAGQSAYVPPAGPPEMRTPPLDPGVEAGQNARAAIGGAVRATGTALDRASAAVGGAVSTGVNAVRGFLGDTTPTGDLGRYAPKTSEYDFAAPAPAPSAPRAAAVSPLDGSLAALGASGLPGTGVFAGFGGQGTATATPVVNAPVDRNNLIGTTDAQAQRTASASLGTDRTPGSITPTAPPVSA